MHDDRECRIVRQSIGKTSDACISYEALSYVWGRPDLKCKLSTPEGMIRITQSLAEALHHLRCAYEPRNIWADGICIDQSNVEERGHQVKVMGRIYSGAIRVLIWLGSDLKNEAEDTFAKLTDYVTFGSPTYGLIEEHATTIERAYDIFRSGWLSRVWVIQEFVLARDVLFVVGNSKSG